MAADSVIRRFRAADADAVQALWRDVFPDDPPWNAPAAVVRWKVAVSPELFWVATVGEQVVGTVMAGWDGHRGWIYHLAVAAAQRRRGIGRALMAEAEATLRSLGCPKVNLQVRATNADAARFYERVGYAIEARISMGKRL